MSRQIGVFVGSLLILTITYLFVGWIRAKTVYLLLVAGLVWLVLTLFFELGFGRFAAGLSWERILSDYDVRQGGLLPFGLILLTFSPLIASKLRTSKT